jgi:hypothetical protein
VEANATSVQLLAPPVLAALDEIARRGCERIVRRAERRDLAVMVVVDAEMQPHLGHPLGVAHRTGPRANHFLRGAPTTLDDRRALINSISSSRGGAARPRRVSPATG